jgi:hypothetical protein
VSVTVTGPSAWQPSDGEQRALAYVEWRLACIRVWATYRDWRQATRADGVLAHAVYEAALDREAAAATTYARLMKRACDPIRGPGHARSAERANDAADQEGGC